MFVKICRRQVNEWWDITTYECTSYKISHQDHKDESFSTLITMGDVTHSISGKAQKEGLYEVFIMNNEGKTIDKIIG